MLISEGSDVAASSRATPWPFVIAVLAAVTLTAYLAVWGKRYGLDLKVYRNAVSSWRSGQDPYLLTFTRSGLPFTYPPFALLALSPLALASFPVTQLLLGTASLAAATGSIALIQRGLGAAVTRRSVCKAFAWSLAAFIALEPARSALDYGQVESILMFNRGG
jgi:alpha-1,2-mannosyltransferase